MTSATPALTVAADAPGNLGGLGKSYRFVVYDDATTSSPRWQSAAQSSAFAVATLSLTLPAGVLNQNGGSVWWAVEPFFDGVASPITSRKQITLQVPPSLPRTHSPSDTGRVATLTPTLQVLSGPNSPLAPISFQFRIATDSAFTNIVSSSANWTLDPSFTVPEGLLGDGQTYYWQAQARNKFATTGWSAATSFTTGAEYLGRGDWAMSDHGPVSVNLKTGNAVLSIPGPAYPTVVGSLGLSLAYNSHNAANEGFGPGIALAASGGGEDDASPVGLVDHNLLPAGGAEAREDVIEVLTGDGWSDFYTPAGDGFTYVPEGGVGATLKKRGPRVRPGTAPAPWTMTITDGSVFTFGEADPLTGKAALLGAELTSAKRNQARLVYRLDGLGRLIGIVDPTRRILTLDWAGSAFCTDAIVCVSLRDDADTPPTGQQKRKLDAVVWKYQGPATNRAAGPLERIVWDDGTTQRAMMQLGWAGANPTIATVKGANTLNPPPGHNGEYGLGIVYDTPVGSNPAKVIQITGGPVSGRTPATATWSFNYNPIGTSVTTNPTQADHAPHIGSGVTRTAASVTAIQGPRGGTRTFWMDRQGRAIQTRDELGRTGQVGFANGVSVWTEDPIGASTDTTYDPVTKAPVKVLAPSVQVVEGGATITTRPETLTFYDERSPGAGRTTGPVLAGLRGDYFDNRNLAGRPYATRTDANVDFDWTAVGYPAPLQGATGETGTTQIVDDFSVRWSGTLDLPAGTYVFSTTANGGTRVAIDGALVLSRWIDDGTTTTIESETVVVPAGRHRLEVSFFDGIGSAAGATLKYRLSTAPPSSSVVVPSSALQPAYLNATSVVSPTSRRSFTHLAEPWRGLPDYTLARLDPGEVSQADSITSYTYDQFGRTVTKTMPRGNVARLDTGTGDLTGTPDSRFTTTWVYYGLATGETQPHTADIPACDGDAAITGAYQAGGLKEKRVPGLATQTFVYDSAGRLRSSAKARGRICTTYTPEGRVATSTTRADDAALKETTTYTYDPGGQVLTVSTPGKGVVTNEYDEAGRVTRSLDSFATPPPAPPGTATDASAPTVVITSPSPSATVSGTNVSVIAEAGDDVDVVGVQFKLNGQDLGPEDTRPPYRVVWDTTKSAGGSLTLTAVARDASGKSTTSAPVAVTNPNCPSLPARSGLVASYDFNENAGTTLTDRSGSGNNGTISGATWTAAGHCGSALSFNGVDTTPDGK